MKGSTRMRTSVRRGLSAAAIAGGISLLGFAWSSASADEGHHGGRGLHLELPVSLAGNEGTVLGHHNTNASSTGAGGGAGGPHGPAHHERVSARVDRSGVEV